MQLAGLFAPLRPVLLLHGGMTPRERGEPQRAFNAPERCFSPPTRRRRV